MKGDDWPPELRVFVYKMKTKLEGYGFRTDLDEMFEQLGLAVLVKSHVVPDFYITNLLGASIVVELEVMPYKKRKIVLKKLRRLYATYLEKKKTERKAKGRTKRKPRSISQAGEVASSHRSQTGNRRKQRQ